MKHLYVHIPFCRSRCAYCDFASEPIGPHRRVGRVERYLAALRAELEERGGGARFDTIYLGGGTPTAIGPDALLGLVAQLAGRLAERNGCPAEFSVEANPGTIDTALLQRLAAAGVTRLSLGIQSFVPALRAALGRGVAQTDIEKALAAIAASGWNEWNIDLVFGIPGQTWDLARADLQAAIDAKAAHVSFYDLTYTSVFAARVDATRGAGAREAAGVFAERHYGDAVAMLEDAGYLRYEVSNFALPGHECRHNQAYWQGEDYLGIGASAVSTIGCERRTNPRTVTDYLAGRAPEIEPMTPKTRLWEKAMLGLRTTAGVDEDELLEVLDQSSRDRLLAQGCLDRRYNRLRLNSGFFDVSNTIIGTLLIDPGEQCI